MAKRVFITSQTLTYDGGLTMEMQVAKNDQLYKYFGEVPYISAFLPDSVAYFYEQQEDTEEAAQLLPDSIIWIQEDITDTEEAASALIDAIIYDYTVIDDTSDASAMLTDEVI